MEIHERVKAYIEEHGDDDTLKIDVEFIEEGTQYHVRIKCCDEGIDRLVPASSPHAPWVFDAIGRWRPKRLRPEPVKRKEIIWRYMRQSHFNWLLENRALYCSRLDLLQDEFEGSLPIGYPDHMSHLVLVNRHLTYVNCWHLSTIESALFWELYKLRFPGELIVAIRSAGGALEDCCQTMLGVSFNPVIYIDHSVRTLSGDDWKYISPAYLKRIEYHQEWEVRLSVFSLGGRSGNILEMHPELPTYVPMPIDVNKLLWGAVVVMPGCSDAALAEVDEALKKSGCPARAYRSSLDAPPIYWSSTLPVAAPSSPENETPASDPSGDPQ